VVTCFDSLASVEKDCPRADLDRRKGGKRKEKREGRASRIAAQGHAQTNRTRRNARFKDSNNIPGKRFSRKIRAKKREGGGGEKKRDKVTEGAARGSRRPSIASKPLPMRVIPGESVPGG